MILSPFIKTFHRYFVQPLKCPRGQLGFCLSECAFGGLSDVEPAAGNGLEKTVALALYGTFKNDDKDNYIFCMSTFCLVKIPLFGYPFNGL